ncbi:DnaJ family domain-containing protein [Edaphobacillus lindanitolerans]|uniref:DnaJ homologue subfamily C member 28 conserved domain-containing protein n=1 Tax=Edaphobacillus lindanitolerans TaxID=550447 RepID=A0A1U7PQJ1_9BACI|nr:DUF1992 domain-containing protein [Edaphobacillus lindanitolerans]SIT83583.1 protein of unknown function [Edaphobacillus lindanitolerans]
MNWILIEDAIRKAREEGKFEHLPGRGKPLPKDEFEHLPADIRMAVRILKNSGYDDEAMFVQKEMTELGSRINHAPADTKTELEAAYNKQMKKMNSLLSKKGVSTNSSAFKEYNRQIQDKLKW